MATAPDSESLGGPGGQTPPDVLETTVCIVGAGPAGAILALLLAQAGVEVVLLETHRDFDREFRGDTVHPSTLELLDELGLVDRVLALAHSRMTSIQTATADGPFAPIDLSYIEGRYPFVAMVPQARLLGLLTAEAARYPAFHLYMGATVHDLLRDPDGTVRGVTLKAGQRQCLIRAKLVVGADGRFSRVRKLIGEEPIGSAPPMDVLWFRLSRRSEDGDGVITRVKNGHILIQLDRGDHWQLGFIFAKGHYQELRQGGLPALQAAITALAPNFADRIGELTDFRDFSLLSVESSRVRRWYRPGLLLIGDAAHVMSPIAGVGINFAIQDAVVAFNRLTRPLRDGTLDEADLAAVQRTRELPTRIIQAFQAQAQKRIVHPALSAASDGGSDRLLKIPAWLRFLTARPLVKRRLANLLAYGPVRVHIDRTLLGR